MDINSVSNLRGIDTNVDLVVNTFERTYRKVLSNGFFDRIEESNRRKFAKRILLINNVNDVRDVTLRVEQLLRDREIDAYYFVKEHLDNALSRTGLSYNDLKPFSFFLDWAIVAVTLPGSQWFVHWDAEVELKEPVNWIDASIDVMNHDSRILIANPNWSRDGIHRESSEYREGFALGYGMSDQVFLAKKSELNKPIYNYFCPASFRYPLSHLMSIFEKRIDAYMRRTGKLRATCLSAVYVHPDNEGLAYDNLHLTVQEQFKNLGIKILIKTLRSLNLKSPCFSVRGGVG